MDNLTDKQWEKIIKKEGCAFKPLHIVRGEYANTSVVLRLYISLLAKQEEAEAIFDVFDEHFKQWDDLTEEVYEMIKKRKLEKLQ